MTNDEHQNEHAQTQETPQELRGVIPQLQGEPDEDPVMDAEEAAAKGIAAHEEDAEDEYIDADDLMELLGQMKEMLEAQSKEIRGLRREMRELREAGGVSQPQSQGGGDRGGFRPREDRGERPSGDRNFGDREFRPRENSGDEGGFRPRARADRGWGNKRSDEE